MPALFGSPEHWRERAREARALAKNIPDEKARNDMLTVAESYEKLTVFQLVVNLPKPLASRSLRVSLRAPTRGSSEGSPAADRERDPRSPDCHSEGIASTRSSRPSFWKPQRNAYAERRWRNPPGNNLGLFWYTREVFRNFVLKVDWLSFNPGQDNSGVFISFPALNASDPPNDWRVPVDNGYEIQIDDTGFNPDTGKKGDALHQTAAVYTLAPSSNIASKPAGQWNTFEIEATIDRIKVALNGQAVTDCPVDPKRPPVGHIGLQTHTGNVQFRNVMIRSLTG